MIGPEDAMHTFEYLIITKILPMIHSWSSDPNRIKDGLKVDPDFKYVSNTNTEWMSVDTLASWIRSNLKCCFHPKF